MAVTRHHLALALCLFSGLELAMDARSARKEEIVDLSKSVPLASRLPCDGFTAPEDHVSWRATFSKGASDRSFNLNVFQKDACKFDLKFKCIGFQPAGWRDGWITSSSQPTASGTISLRSCYAWGTAEHAQYMLSGWYKEDSDHPKLPWKQAALKKVSSNPEIYEFAAPNGETARLEITRR